MPRQHPAAFRQALVDRTLSGESVLSRVAPTGVPEQTLHRWKTQGRVDAGLVDGVTSTESQACGMRIVGFGNSKASSLW